MILRRKTELHVNTGKYESVILSAEIELNDTDLGDAVGSSVPAQKFIDAAQSVIDDALAKDVQEARDVSAIPESFIHFWKNDQETV